MTAASILEMIQIATQLANVIQEEVNASDSQEVQDAWENARKMFAQGFAQAYPEAK